MNKILVIEDDPTFARTLDVFLSKQGYEVKLVSHLGAGVQVIHTWEPQLLLLDQRLPDGVGTGILPELATLARRPQVILMTGFSEVRTAVKAMKLGAYDYITKPVNPDELKMLVQQALAAGVHSTRPRSGDDSPHTDSQGSASVPAMVKGSSLQSKLLHEHIALVAPTDMTVLIQGESGTGKEYVARSIHAASKRSGKAFVAVDCGALSEELAISELFGHVKGAFTGATSDKSGQFVAARGGTLFLDEVGNLSYEVQVKLLRALQERVIQPLGSNEQISTDVRILTATNEQLLEKVREAEFREDLYHRINEFKIQVPALIERMDDFWDFANHFRLAANEELDRHVVEFSPEVTQVFERYSWPGNLRELRNVIRRAVLLSMDSSSVGLHCLPAEMLHQQVHSSGKAAVSPYDLKAQKEFSEKEMILKTLQDVKFNKSKAARLLNIDRKTLYLKITKYGIDA